MRELDTPDPCASQSHLRAAFDRAAFCQTSPPSQSTSATLADRIDVYAFAVCPLTCASDDAVPRALADSGNLPRDFSRIRDFLDISIYCDRLVDVDQRLNHTEDVKVKEGSYDEVD